ncbi:hypothetical protein RND71_042765 [Anisodus tanguticus]|uniref:Uncharacterized protein n=1 Tax=Anisodus tanguticus TaxID=243964 RepID=A0AAE1QRG8_9SOLA|nr:hypothetical protein RND71_042765 [Anisodus tanguticus]
MIVDITGTCLTNLQRVISMPCHHGTIEERAKGVRSAILLLGKTENILEILRSEPHPSSVPDQLAKNDHWCTLSKEKRPLYTSGRRQSCCGYKLTYVTGGWTSISAKLPLKDKIQKPYLKDVDPNAFLKESPSKWPTNMLAVNCMYRVCQTLLQNSDSKEFEQQNHV